MWLSYAACLREKAKDCEFEDRITERILVHLIQTIKDNDLIKRSIQKKWDLDRFIKEESQREDINQQVKDMKDTRKYEPRDGKEGERRGRRRPPKRPPNRRKQEYKKEGGTDKSCIHCGKTGTHPPGQNCPAYGQQCRNCGNVQPLCFVLPNETKPIAGEKQRDVQRTSQESSRG